MPHPDFTSEVEFPEPTLPPELDQSALTLENVRYNPRHRYYSNNTQIIANKLPQHSLIRRRKQSNGQEFLNSIAGVPIQVLEEGHEEELHGKFLQITTLDQPDIVLETSVSESIDLDEPLTLQNFVPNSYFQVWTHHHLLPDGWQSEQSDKISVVTGLEGHNALRLTVADGTDASPAQTILTRELNMRIRAEEEWTISLFYRTPTNALVSPSTAFGVKVDVDLDDGTTNASEGFLDPSTGTVWQRLVHTFSFAKEVIKVRLQILISDTDAFEFNPYWVEVDCIQLELGNQATPWKPRPDDKYWYMDRDELSPIHISGSDSATQVDTTEDFWSKSVPNRVSFIASDADVTYTDPANYITKAGRYPNTDFWGKTYYFAFEVQGSQLRYADIVHTDDILQDFYLAFRNHEGFYKIRSADLVLETLTSFGGYLWVIGKLLGLDGVTTQRFLFVVDPKFPWPADSEDPGPHDGYLEVVTSVKLPDSVPIGESMVAVEFKNEDRQHLFVYSDATLYTLRLHYDIYAINRDSRKILLRENYAGVSIF